MSDKVDFFDNFFAETGALSKAVENYQMRVGQIEMSKFIDEALHTNQSVAIEAGTGIGKTIGYLMPSIRQNKKIIISTATKNLQEQMLKKDFPILQKALGINFNVTLLKGRTNYLCHHRIQNNSNLFYSKKEVLAFNDIEHFFKSSKTGDISEIQDLELSGNVLHAVTSTSENCLFNECKYSKDCFVNKARRRAHQAEVVIVNHHLFFSDFFNDNDEANNLLPSSDVIVFDEAHNLIDLATLYSSKVFSSLKLNRVLDEFISHLKKSVVSLDKFSNIFQQYNFLISQMMDYVKDENRRVSLHKLNKLDLFREASDKLSELLSNLILTMNTLGFINKDIDSCVNELKSMNNLLTEIAEPIQDKNALWLERFSQSFSIHITPIDVKGIFNDTSKFANSCLVFTSATITTNGTFDYFKELTGLSDIKTQIFESPFDYNKNAILHIPEDLPDPNAYDFFSSLVDYIYPAIKLNQGRTLILTTSLKGIDEIAECIESILKKDANNLKILKQGLYSNHQLISQFKKSHNTVLIGSYSFWEGIDLIGDDLTLLVIDKLPFKSPDDPIVEAKINLLKDKNFFMKTQIPMTTLMMKQGLGRLIRDFSDRGVAIIGDNRIRKKFYGKQILSSLPPYKIVSDYNEVLQFIEDM